MSRLVALALRAPRRTLAVLTAATLLLGLGLPQLGTEAGYRAFLGADHPTVERLDGFARRFGGGLPFAAVWSCAESTACESVFDAASLRMAWAVASRLEREEGVARVDGPATSPLLVRPVIGLPEARRLTAAGELAPDLARLVPRALGDATWVGQIVSEDGLAGALVVQLASSDTALGVRALDVMRQSLAPFEGEGFVFHLVGGPVEFVVAGGELERATAQMVPVMVLLVGLVLAALFRRPAPALVGLVGVGLAVVWTLGALGWLGWPQNSLTQVLPPLVLVIGVCDTIHLLAAYAMQLPRGGDPTRADRESALLAAARAVGRPCLFTTLTTVAGFLSFVSSGLESFARFGAIAAWAVVAALLLSFTWVPVLAVWLPARWMRAEPADRSWDRGLAWVARVSPAAARRIVAATLALAALGALGMTRLQVDARFEDLYGEGSQVVGWVRGASAHLREAETLEIALELPPDVRLDSPEALATLAALEPLAEREGLARPLSVLTPMREVHRMLHDEELELGPEADPDRPGQVFRLMRRAAPGFTRLFADADGGALRISFQAGKSPMERLREIFEEVDAHLEAELPPGYGAVVTGPLAAVTEMIEEIRRTQLTSFALAGALVLALTALFFRSLRLGLMALVPTLLPVLVTLGAMGWLGIALDVGSAMVAAVVLGLAVDDAIHLLDAVARRRRAGDEPVAALAAAVREVGRALTTTSVALTVGFTALALSPWATVASFGQVTAIAIFGALAGVLVVLPALVRLGVRRSEG